MPFPAKDASPGKKDASPTKAEEPIVFGFGANVVRSKRYPCCSVFPINEMEDDGELSFPSFLNDFWFFQQEADEQKIMRKLLKNYPSCFMNLITGLHSEG